MATLAFATEAAVVHVVNVVTVDASAGQTDFSVRRLLVAGKTIETLVAAVQLEMGAPVVVEVPRLPVARVVAGSAVGAESLLVLVVRLVAGVAVGLGVLERRCEVALLALDFGVLAEQRKARQAVVEARFLPALLVVAGLAFLAFLAFVLVVLEMTGDAFGFELVAVQVAGVAGLALGLGVLAP